MGLFDSFKKKGEEQTVADNGLCDVCMGQRGDYTKQLISGHKICYNCEHKMRITYYKGFDGFDDELDILTANEIRQDIERDNNYIKETPALFPDSSAVGYMDSIDEYGDIGETWFPALCCKGTFAVGDSITRVQGDKQYDHIIDAIVMPNGLCLEDSVNKGGFESPELKTGEWGWIKVKGEFMDDPAYTGKNYIFKK